MLPRVLFLCTENSCRSQLAEGFARKLGAGVLDPYSAGSRPSGAVHPTALEVLAERGVDPGRQRSKGFDALPTCVWDFVITMGCGDRCPVLPARRKLDWAIPDPKALSPEEFRKVADLVEARVRELVDKLQRGG